MLVKSRRNHNDALLTYYHEEFFFKGWIKDHFSKELRDREFGFKYKDNNAFVRGIFFENISEFCDFLRATAPTHVYVGALYHNNPFMRRQSITKLRWKGRELTLDIDIDSQQWRLCGCQGTRLCMDCLKFLIIGAQFYDTILKDHFGFKKVQWFFSGRRGVHCWVFDEEALRLNAITRAAIIDYMSVQGQPFKKLNFVLQKVILERLISPFFALASLEELKTLEFPEHLIKQKQELLRIGYNNRLKKIKTANVSSNTLDRLMKAALIPVDRAVTTDCTHLIRLPYSINGDTKRIVAPIRDINEVDAWIDYFFSSKGSIQDFSKEIADIF